MSCDTLSNTTVRFTVSFGQLPENFCPTSMQDLGNNIVSRIIVTPNQSFSTFAIGPNAPTTNVGPWLKNCLSWFVFDDATASYVPIPKGGFDSQVYYTASDTFVVPDNIFKLKIHAWGGGGGGGDTNGTGGWNSSGGGGAAYGCSIVAVTPAQSIPFTIGAGGSHGIPGSPGSDTVILGMTAGAGLGGTMGGGANPPGGAGGTATGFTINRSGGAGGSAVSTGGAPTGPGGDAAGGGGAGGAIGTTGSNPFVNGVAPGGGGGGHVDQAGSGGSGAGGAVWIEY